MEATIGTSRLTKLGAASADATPIIADVANHPAQGSRTYQARFRTPDGNDINLFHRDFVIEEA